MKLILSLLLLAGSALAFVPLAPFKALRPKIERDSRCGVQLSMTADGKIILIGVAADSGCGKSTFMRRLTKVFGGSNVGPLGGGFGAPGGWETNTLVSDMTTVICLDDYHLNDRTGRKVSGLTALNVKEQRFDLMYEQLKALKEGKSISKPIYNHVNGTLDTPETVVPTNIVIVEGLHPCIDPKVRELLDFTIYLDISDDIKKAWKIQRDMAERGWTLEQIVKSIEDRKPDFNAYVAPQMEFSDIVISVLPSEVSKEPLGTHLKVKMIQAINKPGLSPTFIGEASGMFSKDISSEVKVGPTCGVKLASYHDKFYNRDVQVVEMDGRVEDIHAFEVIEKYFKQTSEKNPGDLAKEMIKIGDKAPGSLDGTGFFQTLTAFKLREYYECLRDAECKLE